MREAKGRKKENREKRTENWNFGNGDIEVAWAANGRLLT
jgi:hypothetical protein